MSLQLSDRIGVRGAIHQALLKRGIDPIPRDPWYYPTARQYEIVSFFQSANAHLSYSGNAV